MSRALSDSSSPSFPAGPRHAAASCAAAQRPFRRHRAPRMLACGASTCARGREEMVMRLHTARVVSGAGIVVLALMVGACSGDHASKTPTPASTRTTAAATPPASTPASAATPLASATADQASTATPARSSVPGGHACSASDIQARASEQGLPGAIGGVLILTNGAATTCALTSDAGSSAPHLSLTDGRGAAIATQRSPLSGDALSSVTLAAGQRTSVTFTWSNWCGAAPAAPISLSIALSGGAASARISGSDATADATPRCDDSSQPSTLAISGFSPAQ